MMSREAAFVLVFCDRAGVGAGSRVLALGGLRARPLNACAEARWSRRVAQHTGPPPSSRVLRIAARRPAAAEFRNPMAYSSSGPLLELAGFQNGV